MYNNVSVNHPLIKRENNYVSIPKNISVHSDDRDKSKWPYANEFQIQLPQAMKQVQYIKLCKVRIPGKLINISSSYQNNKLVFYDGNTSTNNYKNPNVDGRTYKTYDWTGDEILITTNGCGENAEIDTAGIVINANGDVTSIRLKNQGTNYKPGEILTFYINGVPLDPYTIVNDVNNANNSDVTEGGSGWTIDGGTLKGTMPKNPNNIPEGTYTTNSTKKVTVFTIPDGCYTPAELGSVIGFQMNDSTITNWADTPDIKATYFSEYNSNENKFYFGTSLNSEFGFFFGNKANEIIIKDTNLNDVNCSRTTNNYHLYKILGFEENNYLSASSTKGGFFLGASPSQNNVSNNNTIISTEDNDARFTANQYYNKWGKVWLPPTPADAGSTITVQILTPPRKSCLHSINTIYMEIDKYNNSDELVPFVENTSAFNVTGFTKNKKNGHFRLIDDTYRICHDKTVNYGTHTIDRRQDSSIRTQVIKERSALANPTVGGNYGGKVNSYFAKLDLTNSQSSDSTFLSGDDIDSITIFQNQLEERIEKLKFKFRLHDGTPIDLGDSDIDFTIQFGLIASDQEKNMNIRTINNY